MDHKHDRNEGNLLNDHLIYATYGFRYVSCTSESWSLRHGERHILGDAIVVLTADTAA